MGTEDASKQASAAPAAADAGASGAPAAAAATQGAANGASALNPDAAGAAAEAAMVLEDFVDDGADEVPEEDFSKSCQNAREILRQLHVAVGRLSKSKPDDTASTPAPSTFPGIARDMQLSLLALRRAHRNMARMTEAGKSSEAEARRKTDAAFAELDARRYESSCTLEAARRCRVFPTPGLDALRECIDGLANAEEKEEEEAAAEGTSATLTSCLEAEKLERERLAKELEGLEQQRPKELEKLRELEKLSTELTSRLSKVEKALGPLCDLLELRPRLAQEAPEFERNALAQLLPSLRVIYSKFDVLASLGSGSGVRVSVEGVPDAGPQAEPPLKRPRLPALEVVIASARGLALLDGTLLSSSEDLPSPYVVAEVPGKKQTKVQTKAVANTGEPTWSFRGSMSGFGMGDRLDFEVWSKEAFPNADRCLGRVQLAAHDVVTGKQDLKIMNGKQHVGSLLIEICGPIPKALVPKPSVCVDISPLEGGGKAARLRFSAPRETIVAVAGEGAATEAALAGLWPDDAQTTPALAAAAGSSVGKPYGWVQVLAGQREVAAAVAPCIADLDGVVASEVAHRVRKAVFSS